MAQGASFLPPSILFTSEERVNTASLPGMATALDYFRLYLTNNIIDLIVTETYT